jgi:hypothetical protein
MLEDISSSRQPPPPSEVALLEPEPEFNPWSHLQNGEVYGDIEKPAMKQTAAKPALSLKQMVKIALWCICALVVMNKVMRMMQDDVSGSATGTVQEPYARYADNHDGWSTFDLHRERAGGEVVF